jgi:hypothetical protein
VVGEIIERRKVREEEQVGKGEGWRYGSRKRSQDCVRTPTWGARWTEEEVVSVVRGAYHGKKFLPLCLPILQVRSQDAVMAISAGVRRRA